MNVKNFDASTVPLQGTNLVEASAGTGKTYSIAIMVLRLILEKEIEVKEILMVTFTKAAVAELQERIWLFIRQAHKISLGEPGTDDAIAALVNTAMEKTSKDEVRKRLRNAVLFLDETSVLTIHSFCQQTLTEFAFETNQLFNAETLKDLDELVKNEVNKFWRENITTLDANLLGQLLEYQLKRADIVSVIKEHLSGKKYFKYDESETYSICGEDQVSFSKAVQELEAKDREMKECLYEHVRENTAHLKSLAQTDHHARRNLYDLIDTPAKFIQAVVDKRTTAYVVKLYSPLLQQQSDCDAVAEEKDKLLQLVVNKINCHAIATVTKAIDRHKQRNSLLTFDDMIINLHKAVVHDNNQQLVGCLQRKYKAVFADEFQDTDKLQYEIFHRAYGSGQNVLFYIGDPKQSIYAWRKADIFTYFKAAAEVGNMYSMNINYRSSPRMIQAMNLFFKPTNDFDTFCFGKQANAIEYIKVQPPAATEKGELLANGKPDVPITIFKSPKNDHITETVTAQVLRLLTEDKYQIQEKTFRRVTPTDIGILVKTNKQAIEIKSSLSRRGIPAVTIDDTKILQSEEVLYVMYILEALVNINRSTINKALLSPFTGYDTTAILSLNEEIVLDQFREYKNIWDVDGVYSLLVKFISDYQVKSLLLRNDTENGERALANLFQLIEVLHKVQSAKHFSAPELVNWLKRGIDGMQTEGDEFEQRLESDEEAVKIVTIHKSKGLEYNIVFAPFLDLNQYMGFGVFSFRDIHTGDYLSIPKGHLTPENIELLKEQSEQEYRRLIYVAVTRAVYKCYVSRNTYYKESSLVPFVTYVNESNPDLIRFEDTPALLGRYYTDAAAADSVTNSKTVDFQLSHVNWRKISYTSLSAAHTATPKISIGNYQNEYDHFVFRLLAKGKKTGNLLHFIFENIDFASDTGWKRTIQNALKRFMPASADTYAPLLLQLLQHVTGVSIEVSGSRFSLLQIRQQKRLNELEFDFNVPVFNPKSLNSFDDGLQISVKLSSDIQGILNGKMDMFFEHEGRYYILDWKSNYLGDTLDCYNRDALKQAMDENNYHLQYLLYTIAAKKFLSSRLVSFNYERDFGGVIYLFVRGVRTGSYTGIFVTKPAFNHIERLEGLLAEQEQNFFEPG